MGNSDWLNDCIKQFVELNQTNAASQAAMIADKLKRETETIITGLRVAGIKNPNESEAAETLAKATTLLLWTAMAFDQGIVKPGDVKL